MVRWYRLIHIDIRNPVIGIWSVYNELDNCKEKHQMRYWARTELQGCSFYQTDFNQASLIYCVIAPGKPYLRSRKVFRQRVEVLYLSCSNPGCCYYDIALTNRASQPRSRSGSIAFPSSSLMSVIKLKSVWVLPVFWAPINAMIFIIKAYLHIQRERSA